MLVLFIGIVLSGIVGLWTGSFDIWGWNASMGLGITNMGDDYRDASGRRHVGDDPL
mgnify:CR=1 FL=1